MSPLLLVALLGAAPAEKAPKPLPTLSKDPVVDGSLADLTGAQELKVPAAAAKGLKVRAGYRKDTLYLGLTAPGSALATSSFVVSLFFPTAGTTARGTRLTISAAGITGTEEDGPAWARSLVQVKGKDDGKAPSFEVAIPARALPRFPAQGPLMLSLCVDLKTPATELSSCNTGDMVGGPVRLPDELRKTQKLVAPAGVEGVEARPKGWVGYAVLHFPSWVLADEELSPESLTELIAGKEAVEPKTVALPIPRTLSLPDGRPLFPVLTGQNPYVGDDCKPQHELRMSMYVIKGNQAVQVLEWPAATCALGRAMRFELSPEGFLTIGYTNGSTARFTFTQEHFERAELGAR